MRVLFVGTQMGFSGYSSAARGYIRALYNQDVDLILRHVRYDTGDDEYQLQDWERKLYCKAAQNVDIVIQHVTPNEFAHNPDANFKQIGMFATETDLIPEPWAQSCQRMDALITFCDMSREAIKKAGVTKPVYKIPHTFDMESFKNLPEPYETLTGVSLKENRPCIFYNICQVSPKKGIDKLLRAYWGAFQNDENVLLVLKGYINPMNRAQDEEQLSNFLNEVRDGTRFKKYPPVVILTEIMSEEEIRKLHATCDIYVNASSGEGFGIPIFDAAACGNSVISTNWGGPKEYLHSYSNSEDFYDVFYSLEPVYGMKHPHPYMFSSYENWAVPQVDSMIHQMQRAYDDWKENKLCKVNDLSQFDYSVVGKEFKKVLEEIYNDGK